MKKLFSVMIVLAMVLSIVPAMSLAAAEGEPTTVTIATTWQVPDYFNDTNENKALLEQENIYLKAVYAPTDKLGLMLSSNDLTDIVIGEFPFLSTVISNGMAKELDGILDEYIPNYNLDLYKTCTEILRMQMSGGTGKLFFFVPGQGVEYAGSNDKNIRGYCVRWDLYKELGMPEIKDDRDYVQVLSDMLALTEGVTEDGKTMYGIGLDGTAYGSWYSRGRYVAEAGTRPTFSGYLYEASVKDGTLINGYTDLEKSAMWVDLRFYNDCYNAGILDPDSFTMTSAELSEKVKAGVYMGVRSRDNGMYTEAQKVDPETLKGFVMIPSKGAVMHADFQTPCGFAPDDYYFISNATENWEAAARAMNFYLDPNTIRMIYSGIEGTHWNYVDGVPTMNDDVVALASEVGYGTDAFVEQTGIWGGYWELTPFTNTGVHPDGSFFDLFNEQMYRKNSLTYLDKDYATTYGFETPSAYHCSLIDSDPEYTTLIGERGLLCTLGINEIPQDVQRILVNCNDIFFNRIAELVMAESDDEFNAIAEEVLAEFADAGEADAWAWCSEAYATEFAEINPIFEELQANYLANPAGRP